MYVKFVVIVVEEVISFYRDHISFICDFNITRKLTRIYLQNIHYNT